MAAGHQKMIRGLKKMIHRHIKMIRGHKKMIYRHEKMIRRHSKMIKERPSMNFTSSFTIFNGYITFFMCPLAILSGYFAGISASPAGILSRSPLYSTLYQIYYSVTNNYFLLI